MRLNLLICAIFLLAACAGEGAVAADSPAHPERPNILLIVVDDMGFSDLGSFGSEIATPSLDRLAMAGIRFSNLHGSSMCSPSRAMLLTGVDSHRTGFGNMLEELAPNQQGKPGYEGYLNERVVTLPTLLQDAGYRTYMTGKWHLGSGPGKGPAFRGFDRSFVLESGGASHFADMRPAYAASPDAKASYSEDGVALDSLPAGFEYSTQYYVDRMLSYLGEHTGAKPFFAYLAFTAPHWPLQAPEEAIARQSGRYDAGYDVIANARLERLKEMGLVPRDARRSGRSPKEAAWTELEPAQRQREMRAMEVYAAMIEEVDAHTGRLIDFLEGSGALDNTLVFFMSDNGPEGHDLDETWPMQSFPEIRSTIDATHDFSYEAMGRPGSYVLYGPNWANAGSPAFRLHKAFPTEGGTRVAAFAYYPKSVATPRIADDFVHVTDLVPTILEFAGVAPTGERYRGRAVEPVSGRSFLPLLHGDSMRHAQRISGEELLGKRAIRDGAWKLVHMPKPHGIGDWQLFHLESDLAESTDLASTHPDKVEALKAEWEKYARRNGVIIPNWVSGY